MNSEALRAGVLQIYELRSFPLFKTISDLELKTLTGRSTRRSFERGERLYAEGDRCPGIWLVAAGTVESQQVV